MQKPAFLLAAPASGTGKTTDREGRLHLGCRKVRLHHDDRLGRAW